MFTDNYIELDTVESTNDFILNLQKKYIKEGLVVSAKYQKSGKGQRSCVWESEANKNLLISVVIEPNIKLDKQFEISKIVSLALCDMLFDLGLDSNIKWPNDIIVCDKKIAGILIENKVNGNLITHSIIGVGLNVNQCVFQEFNNYATSLSLLLDRELDIKIIKQSFLDFLSNRIEKFRNGYNYHKDYLKLMYLKDIQSSFEHQGNRFNAIIRGLSNSGCLVVQRTDNIYKKFNIKDIKYII